MFDWGGFSASKLKPHLKMAVSRIQIASNKKAALLKQNMREIAMMLSEDPPKEEKAKIRAEALIRDDNLIEAYEILQLECELLHERIKLIEYSRLCPPDLTSVVATLMWAAHRVDIPELMEIRKQFRAKYGKYFEEDALMNRNNILNERVVTKLSVDPPAAYLVQTYLERICEQFEVDWNPQVKLSTNQMIEPMAAPVGYSVQVAQGTGLGQQAEFQMNYANQLQQQYQQQQQQQQQQQNNINNGGLPPVVTGQPFVLPPPAPGQNTRNYNFPSNSSNSISVNHQLEDVDIVVPGTPIGPAVGGSFTTTATNNNNNNNNISGGVSDVSSSPSNNHMKPSHNSNNSSNPMRQAATVEEDKKDEDDDDEGDDQGGSPSTRAPKGPTSGDVTTSYADLAARFEKLKK